MRLTCAKVIASCPDCQRSKPSRLKPAGTSQPIHLSPDAPTKPFEVLSCDFLFGLPSVESNTGIFLVVDTFSKLAAAYPCNPSITAQGAAKHLQDWFCRYTVPRRLIHDQDVRLTSAWWNDFSACCGFKNSNTSVYHPQSDGQTERTISTITQLLRSTCN